MEAIQRFLDIPELILSLDRFLTNSDRILLIRVNHSFHKILAPLVWTRLDMTSTVRVARLFASPESIQALTRYVGCIHTLKSKTSFLKSYMNCAYLYAQSPTATILPVTQPLQDILLSIFIPPTPQTAATLQSQPPKWLTLQENQEKHSSLIPQLTPRPIPPMTNLSIFEFTISRVDIQGVYQSLQACWLIRMNRITLTRIELTNIPVRNKKLVQILSRTLSRLVRLQELHLEAFDELPLEVFHAIFASFPDSVTSMTLSLKIALPNQTVSVTEQGGNLLEEVVDNDDLEYQVIRRRGPFHKLTRLYIPINREGYTISDLEFILKDCPALEAWGLPTLRSPTISHQVNQLLQLYCPKINQLTVRDATLGPQGRQDFMNILREFSGVLRTIALVKYEEARPRDLTEALQRHIESLQQFILFNTSKVSSLTIQQLLRFGAKLTRLFIMPPNSKELDCSLKLTDAIAFSWTCLHLSHLSLSMDLSGTGAENKYHWTWTVVKEGGTLHEPIQWTTDEMECWKKLGSLYTRLGTLSNLETLILQYTGPSSPTYSSNAIPGLLTLGNESMGCPGFLTKLSSLKKLKIFRGSVSAYTPESLMMLRQEEVEWMVREWPVLEMIGLETGTTVSRLLTDPLPHLDWLKRRKPSLRTKI
ncbi:hypothetical protein FBU30_004467 [Linnemannia zychae]|nr:hypothetical protein FBU30_004467 [Linnemannia zychae]